MTKRIIVLSVVGLEEKHLESGLLPNISKLIENGEYSKLSPVFPSVTSTVQTSLLTGKYPSEHGIIANGLYDRTNYNVSFWEQYSSLVESPRVFDVKKQNTHTNTNLKSAILFWQNSLYSNADIICTPKPIHLEKEMIMWCYSKPIGFYESMVEKIGKFDLMSYWGPFASSKSSEWITNATIYTIERERPDILFTYLPHVDYSAQRYGKDSIQVKDDIIKADEYVGQIINHCKESNLLDETKFIIFSEYGFNNVNNSVSLNKILREHDLLKTREINEKEYLDLENSDAFAMVDHQIAHVYVKDKALHKTKKILEETNGVEKVLTKEDQGQYHIDNQRSGELIAIANTDTWFNYYWWFNDEKAPSFTREVDIHRKPGFDPVELFIDMKSRSIPLNPKLVKGSHGRPPNPDTGEGLSLYLSNTKSDINRDKDNNILNVVNLGEYLMKFMM